MPVPTPSPEPGRWQRLGTSSLRAFHAYAGWLVGISWWRFALLALLLMICASVLKSLPPFRWTVRETITGDAPPLPPPAAVPAAPGAEPPASPQTPASAPSSTNGGQVPRLPPSGQERIEISVGERGVHIVKQGAPTPAAAGSAASAGAAVDPAEVVVDIRLPPGQVSDAVRKAVEEARRDIAEAVHEADNGDPDEVVSAAPGEPRQRIRTVRWGDFLTDLAFFWIVASAIVKVTYKRQIQAEAQAAQAVETAEAEQLKRQLVEARMATMQAQVEPHFLFNTLAAIDHLIETDPQRASQMQKHLIALLRAAMPTMRETGDGAPRDLARELAVVRPYLEILKVRMEERLASHIDVPEGLLSAEVPPMALQVLVENAIKHGLEPQAEGGRLDLKAEVVHGKLVLTVADTGRGLGQGIGPTIGTGSAPTTGTGVGLANIRERLALLYGRQASLTLTENPGGGTRAVLTVPYRPVPNGAGTGMAEAADGARRG